MIDDDNDDDAPKYHRPLWGVIGSPEVFVIFSFKTQLTWRHYLCIEFVSVYSMSYCMDLWLSCWFFSGSVSYHVAHSLLRCRDWRLSCWYSIGLIFSTLRRSVGYVWICLIFLLKRYFYSLWDALRALIDKKENKKKTSASVVAFQYMYKFENPDMSHPVKRKRLIMCC